MSTSSSSSPNEITGHRGYPRHKLIPAGKEAMLNTCEACQDQIFSLDSSYKCTHCKGVLTKYFHGACLNAKPNSTKAYPFTPHFRLKYSPGKEGNINCTACRRSVRGIMYTGSHDNEDYYLHPQCIDLPLNLQRDSIKLKLCCRMQTSMKCHFCRMNVVKQGWCYGISKGEFKYACHVGCLKTRLARDWFRERIPVKLPSRDEYFDSLDQEELRKFKVMAGRLGLKAIAQGLDFLVSSLVGIPAPVATILSLIIDVPVKVAQKKLEAAAKK